MSNFLVWTQNWCLGSYKNLPYLLCDKHMVKFNVEPICIAKTTYRGRSTEKREVGHVECLCPAQTTFHLQKSKKVVSFRKHTAFEYAKRDII